MRVFRIVFALVAFCVMPAAVMAAEDHSHTLSLPADKDAPAAESDHQENIYFCPMHPHIRGEKGDRCPICGMDLVPQTRTEAPAPAPESDAQDENADKEGALFIEPLYRQALGVKTAAAARHKFGRTIQAYGHIAPSTRLERSVAVRTAGWVIDLNTDAVGDTVKAGDLLFTFYSPDLMTAQSDYFLSSRVGNAEQRLRLCGRLP